MAKSLGPSIFDAMKLSALWSGKQQIFGGKMGKLHQMVSFKGLVKLILLFAVSMSLSASAMAQSADAAINVARQWLTLADADQAGQMWEQSSALMKSKSDRSTWVACIGDMNRLDERRPPVGYQYGSIEVATR